MSEDTAVTTAPLLIVKITGKSSTFIVATFICDVWLQPFDIRRFLSLSSPSTHRVVPTWPIYNLYQSFTLNMNNHDHQKHHYHQQQHQHQRHHWRRRRWHDMSQLTHTHFQRPLIDVSASSSVHVFICLSCCWYHLSVTRWLHYFSNIWQYKNSQ